MRRKSKWIITGSLLLAAAMLAGGCSQPGAGRAGAEGVQEAASGEQEPGTGADEGDGAMQEGADADKAGEIAGEAEKDAGSTGENALRPDGLPVQMPAFTTTDLAGNEVTESIFGEKDLTVLNIWGTFCSPCIREMPELGEWAKELPENVQLVGLVVDIEGEDDTVHKELAGEITDKAGADFTHLLVNMDFAPVMGQVVGVPTTLFIDGDGKIVGDPIVGVNVDGYKKFVEDYLSEQ